MGMFDSVMVKCPKCGEAVEFQTKSGPCILQYYTMEDAPADVMGGLDGHTEECEKCGHIVQIKVEVKGCVM